MVVLISGACGVTSRAMARALRASHGRDRLRLVGTDVCHNIYGVYEGLFDIVYKVPPCSAGEPYRRAMLAICRAEGVEAALMVPEPEVLFWTGQELPCRSVLPPPRFAQIAISKLRLYEALRDTDLVPPYAIAAPQDDLHASGVAQLLEGGPVWMRDTVEGGTSARGALLVRSAAELQAWLTLNPGVRAFMYASYLPGRNLAALMLFDRGVVVKQGAYERLEYFMARVAPSGVTGNISRGRIIADPAVMRAATEAVRTICAATGETMHGMVTVDLREDKDGHPKVTEINLRQVAAASAFAHVPGGNLTAAMLALALGRPEEIGPVEGEVPPRNLILRDIDGTPIFIEDDQVPPDRLKHIAGTEHQP